MAKLNALSRAYVWRLEDKHGRGIFAGSPDGAWSVFWAMPDDVRESGKGDPARHPPPHQEGLRMGPNLYCAFSSLAQYKLWFSSSRQRKWLTSRGVVLKKYQTKRGYIQYGQAQALFRKSFAVHVASRRPDAV